MKMTIKNIMNTLVTTALVAVLIFAGFVAGVKRKELVKWYEYGRYLTTAQEETEVMSSGELMNAAQINWAESHGKGETVTRMLSVEDGINGRNEQEAREEDKSHTFIGDYTQVRAMAYTHPGTTIHYICTDEDFFRTEGMVTYEGDWFSGVYHWEGLNR